MYCRDERAWGINTKINTLQVPHSSLYIILYMKFFIAHPYLLYRFQAVSLSGEPDYFGRKKISSGGDLSHYSSASLY